ncbi:MAG: hybrid sensor histidine kinase/response regulator [Ilumatobacteraceae bacterium]
MTALSIADIRGLFATEAEQRLSRLGQLVLDLEQQPDNGGDLIGEIFREVHTLKGSAAVVGFDAVAGFAHELEGRLEQLRSGAVVSNPVIVDALLVAVDRLGVMITASVAEDAEGMGDEDGAQAAALVGLASAFHATTPVPPSAPPTTPVPPEAPPPARLHPVNGPPANVPLVNVPPVTVPPVTVPLVNVSPGTVPRRLVVEREGGTVMVPIGRLDELVRMVGEASTGLLRVGRVLTDRLGIRPDDVSEFGELARVLNELQDRAMRTLMVPVSTITEQLQRAVRDAARSLGKDVRWEVRGESTELDRNVLHQLADALLHLVRNAVDHGIESPEGRAAAGKPAQAVVRLHAMQLGSEVIIAITDDGAGIDIGRVRERALRMGVDATDLSDDEALQLIFRSGLSTSTFVSDISGRGVGLDVVHASVEAARGRVEVRTTRGVGSEFRVVVPITLAVLDCLLVETSGQRFALPLHRIAVARAVDPATELHVEGRRAILFDGRPVPVTDLAEVLDLPVVPGAISTHVVVNGTVGRHAFAVDALVGQRDVVIKALSPLVARVDFIAGTSVEPDGSILLVLDPLALIERARRDGKRSINVPVDAVGVQRRGTVLVVDDALTVRELQRVILERAGFDVRVAGDGVDALEQLQGEPVDLVLTDVEMPRMDGFELTKQIRSRPALANTPILILTSLVSDTDRQRGMDAGADGYIVKSAFDEHGLLAAVDRMIGTAS